MNRNYPCIKVCDIETTISQYADFLGFQCTYKSTISNPDYALLERKEEKIYLVKSDDREDYASNIIVIEVSDINSKYQALQESGAIIFQPIDTGRFSGKEFVIKDYEDNKLVYIQRT